jgi:tetratricopeptide (TPR) repeat protein
MYKGDSVYLFSIEELREKYEDLKTREWKVDKKMTNPYPIIPFCSLPNNELLVFIHGEKSGSESPVFDAFHEEFPSTWGIVTPNFASFLEKYLDDLGHPETIGDENVGVASDYFDLPSERKETPEEILFRTEQELQNDPDYAFHYYERATAFMKTDNLSDAYLSINKAIEIAPEDAFYYYIRGEILNEAKQYRAALINYDIAVKLKPDDTFYLSCRAGSLFQLNKLSASLNDCNQAINMNPELVLPYMMRKEIYLLMGMKDEAEADQIIIDQINEKDA